MSGGQIAALVFAVILLIPGGCFLVFGIGTLGDPGAYGLGPPFTIIGLVILGVAGFLGWVAFRKRKPPQTPA
jgi:membrane protein implicated in regulation of membrane protease activity